jgi:hypothetical protein
MQLFKLINTLLNHQREAFSRNLHLLPYEVIPLSPSAGLLSWVPNTQQYVLLIPTLACDPGNDADERLQSIITANRDRTHNAALSQKEMASMLGVGLLPVSPLLPHQKDVWRGTIGQKLIDSTIRPNGQTKQKSDSTLKLNRIFTINYQLRARSRG